MSAKGDARTERQSSWSNRAGTGRRTWRARFARYAPLGFAGFVLWHFTCQAYRAHTDAAIPGDVGPGMELQPWFIGSVLLLIWLPFAAFAGPELSRSLARRASAPQGQERALGVVEPIALGIVLLFALVHCLQVAWPLLAHNLTGGDLRTELVATLSGTVRGVPVRAIGYVCAVGAASFYATRQTLKALPGAAPALARAVVSLGVLGYLLGSYAVIRCASGTILP